MFLIKLLKNSSTTFETVVFVANGQTPPIQWKDYTLQGRATAIGNIDSPSSAQLRFIIDKNSVQCPDDFKMYKCEMSGFSTDSVAVRQDTSPIIISYIGMYYSLNLFNEYWYSLMYLLTKHMLPL